MDPDTLSKKIRSENMSELAESLPEKNAGDIEDLNFYDVTSDIQKDDEESITLGYDELDLNHHAEDTRRRARSLDRNVNTRIKDYIQTYNLFEGGGYGKGKPLNNSFSGPYNNMDHIHVDRGANTQFE
jgi:hypothetical protein